MGLVWGMERVGKEQMFGFCKFFCGTVFHVPQFYNEVGTTDEQNCEGEEPGISENKRGATDLKADMWVLLKWKAKLLDEERLL